MAIRKILKTITLTILSLIVLYPVVWIAARKGLMGEIEFGYFEEFYIAKHAIEKLGCVSITGIMKNEDVVMEEMFFTVKTRSGLAVRLLFDASDMDVSQVCDEPVGLVIGFDSSPQDTLAQAYNIKFLNSLLKDKNIQVKNLKDALCNIDELAPVFAENRTNNEIPKITHKDSRKYLRIQFADK